MNKNFLSVFGFTIGPIYELMSHAKKTRELWFSSFFFSWYVKRLIKLLREIKCSNGNECFDFLTPDVTDFSSIPRTKAGLFPDHIIGYSKKDINETYELIKDQIKANNDYFINVIDELGKRHYLPSNDNKKVESIFINYLNTSFIVLPLENIGNNNVVEYVDAYLDGLERNRSFAIRKNENTCYRCKSLPSVFIINDSFDQKKKEQKVCPFCFLKFRCNNSTDVCTETSQTSNFRYPSTGEISAFELISKINPKKLQNYLQEYDELSFETETKAGKDFRELLPKNVEINPYHKYMAIVQADGDNLGKTANQVKDPKKLSQLLFNFGLKAKKITDKYHGEPVFIGGDDILAFLPTAFKDENGNFKTVIDYVLELSKEYICTLNTEKISGSLSFGVHLFYYKHPLSLAVKKAREQLFDVAKNVPGKNSLSLLLTQHSGQSISLQFKLGSDELNDFNTLLQKFITNEKTFPQGIHHKLSQYSKLITNLSTEIQLHNFFSNRFNEDIHKTMTGLETIEDILKKRLKNPHLSGAKLFRGEESLNILNQFLSEIKFIKFLAGESK